MAQTNFQMLGKFLPIQFAASTAAFLRCYIDSSGYAAIADADKKSVGVATTGAPAWSGATSANTLTVNHMVGLQTMIANGAITVGHKVYAAASGKVASTGRVLEGVALTAASADGDYIQVMPEQNVDINYCTVADSSTDLNTTAVETTWGQTLAIPANSLTAGDILDIDFMAYCVSVNATPTLTAKLYIGSTNIITSGAVSVIATDTIVGSAQLVIRTAGASGTCIATGYCSTTATATVTMKKVYLASTTIDTTAAQTIDVKGTWSASHASNQAKLGLLRVRRRFGAAF